MRPFAKTMTLLPIHPSIPPSRLHWRTLLARLAIVILLGAAATATAAERINTLDKGTLFGFNETGIAVRGYDTVAYFSEGQPRAGVDQFTTKWMGATWKFASHANLDLFLANPEKYAPQYGGYCAYGISQDSLVKIEVDQWQIVDGKLYLNYDAGVQKTWKKDIPGYIADANRKFDGLIKNQ